MELPEIEVRSGVDEAHIGDLIALYRAEWWTTRRTRDQVEAMLEATDVVVSAVHRPSGRLVGLARAITDGTFVALVLDVIVAAGWRRQGVGTLLMDSLLQHQRLVDVETVELTCQPTLLPFYRSRGFTEQVGASRLMRRTTNPALLGAAPAVAPEP